MIVGFVELQRDKCEKLRDGKGNQSKRNDYPIDWMFIEAA